MDSGLAEAFDLARAEQARRRRGQISEKRALHVLLSSRPRPWWLLAARLANPDEDRFGIDIVVDHDVVDWVGRPVLWLQIKSSEFGRAKFLRSRPLGARIECVVVDAHESDRELYGKLLAAMLVLREGMGL